MGPVFPPRAASVLLAWPGGCRGDSLAVALGGAGADVVASPGVVGAVGDAFEGVGAAVLREGAAVGVVPSGPVPGMDERVASEEGAEAPGAGVSALRVPAAACGRPVDRGTGGGELVVPRSPPS
ncbi:hypothetical protein [Streptomyces sp. SID9727]|uniref:hypothetical protein n=1 Tax=Streptomyces sp. SID9727 TaxID=2706114 RepID=UPI0013C61A1D|nr:hypothetical protein [Streptomyces sp. SID9727]NEC67086.1 hypothetical protein [Streptomyces sp. SID9727]